MIAVAAFRRQRAQAARGNVVTSGMLGRKSNRSSAVRGTGRAGAGLAPTAGAATRGRAPWRTLRYPSAVSCP